MIKIYKMVGYILYIIWDLKITFNSRNSIFVLMKNINSIHKIILKFILANRKVFQTNQKRPSSFKICKSTKFTLLVAKLN